VEIADVVEVLGPVLVVPEMQSQRPKQGHLSAGSRSHAAEHDSSVPPNCRPRVVAWQLCSGLAVVVVAVVEVARVAVVEVLVWPFVVVLGVLVVVVEVLVMAVVVVLAVLVVVVKVVVMAVVVIRLCCHGCIRLQLYYWRHFSCTDTCPRNISLREILSITNQRCCAPGDGVKPIVVLWVVHEAFKVVWSIAGITCTIISRAY